MSLLSPYCCPQLSRLMRGWNLSAPMRMPLAARLFVSLALLDCLLVVVQPPRPRQRPERQTPTASRSARSRSTWARTRWATSATGSRCPGAQAPLSGGAAKSRVPPRTWQPCTSSAPSFRLSLHGAMQVFTKLDCGVCLRAAEVQALGHRGSPSAMVRLRPAGHACLCT